MKKVQCIGYHPLSQNLHIVLHLSGQPQSGLITHHLASSAAEAIVLLALEVLAACENGRVNQ